MDERTRALVLLSAALTAEDAALRDAMDTAVAAAPEEAEEVLLQSYLFLGFPVALNAMGLWRRRTGRRPPERRPAEPSMAALRERGEEVCREVYAGQYEALRTLMAGVHPELDRWAIAEGYGKLLGREGLDLPTRELCVAALLAGTTASRQLHAHLRGCLNVGVPVARVDAMMEAVRDVLPEKRVADAWRVWERVRTRWIERTEA